MTALDLQISSTPYTYVLEWTKFGKRYIGARWAKGCHPDDLWTGYFTSSTYVKEFVALNGPPDIILIDRTFGTGREAMEREHLLLRQYDAIHNESFLNKNIAGVFDPNDPAIRRKMSESQKGKKLSEEAKMKVRLFHTGRKRSALTRKKLSLLFTGKKKSEAHAAKCRIANLGKKASPETRKRLSASLKGNKNGLGYRHSDAAKRKMSESRVGPLNSRYCVPQSVISCPYCGASGGYAAMKWWHFDNCPAAGKVRMPGNRLGAKLSDELRHKMGSAMRGKRHSEETKRKMSRSQRWRKHSIAQ